MTPALQLIQNQKIAAALFGFGSLRLIIAGSLDTNIDIARIKGSKIQYTPTPAQIATFSFGIILIGSLIAAFTATIRLEQQRRDLQRGTLKGTLRPSLWIFAGSWILTLGVSALAAGNKLSAEEQRQITIF